MYVKSLPMSNLILSYVHFNSGPWQAFTDCDFGSSEYYNSNITDALQRDIASPMSIYSFNYLIVVLVVGGGCCSSSAVVATPFHIVAAPGWPCLRRD